MKNSLQIVRQARTMAVKFFSLFSLILLTTSAALAQAPAITTWSPNSGPIGTPVTIFGSGFTGATGVKFGGVAATSVNVVSSTEITATVAIGTLSGKIEVTTPSGTALSTSDFTVFVKWTGGNGLWDVAANWSDNNVPTTNTNVVIDTGSPRVISQATCKDLTLNNATLRLDDALADLMIYGNFSNTGGSYQHSAGKVTFAAASGIQAIPALTYHNMSISGGGEKVLQGNTTVNGSLQMISSHLTTNNSPSITLTLNGAITGENNSSRFVGILEKTVPVNGVVTDTFGGIGISFVNTGGGNWGNVKATRVTGKAIENPDDDTKKSITRHWTIAPDVEVGTAVDLTLTWFEAEKNGLAFATNNAQAWRKANNSPNWQRVDAMKQISSSNNTHSITVRTLAFSMWAITDENNPLPVSWLHFNGKTSDAGNQLNWATATEKNSLNFVVERSADGRSFDAIGTVKAAGSSNQQLEYNFTDKNAPAGQTAYYRLRQNDLDGTFAFSKAISVTAKNRKATLEALAYPNPFGQTLQLQVNNLTETELTLMSVTGQQIYRKTLTGTNAAETISLNDLPNM
ncbi:MAG TPA: hypothetical protein VK927_05465, partial [Adhaeribacter sp.]|nr:hypothetical protein [Adhaeribacter sp.]